MQFDWDTEATSERIAAAFELSIEKMKKSASVFCFVGFDSARAYSDPFRAAKFVVKPAAWVKACPCPPGKGNWWPSAFELGFYGYRKSPYFGDENPTRSNVFVADSYRYGQPGKVDHPTQKPLGLIQRIVSAICPPAGLTLDPTSGSGTTAVACIRTGRRSISIEKEPKYCAIAQKRMEEAIGVGTLFDPATLEAANLFSNESNI